jgi:hypothetical protein
LYPDTNPGPLADAQQETGKQGRIKFHSEHPDHPSVWW